HALGFSQAVRQDHGAAHHLVRLFRIDAEVGDQFHGFVKLDEVGFLDRLGGFRKFIRTRFDRPARLGDVFSRLLSHFFSYPSTSRPMLRAVPMMVRTGESRLVVFKSGNLVLAISSTCLRVTLPTLLRLGSADPLTMP